MQWWGIVLIVLAVLCILCAVLGWLLVDFAVRKKSKIFMDNSKIKKMEITAAHPGTYPDIEEKYPEYPLDERAALMKGEMDLDDEHKEFWTENKFGQKLRAYYYEHSLDTHKYIILVHGYGNSAAMASRMYDAPEMCARGYNILLPDLLAHGSSEGEFVSMSYKDKYTVLAWIKFILQIDPDASIALMGVSMGAATVMVTSGEDLPDNVKCIVEDCGFTNAYEQFAYVIKSKHLPAFPFVNLLELFARLRTGVSFKRDCSPIDCVAKCKKPMFFVHGAEDDFVPTYMVHPLYDACKTEKEKLIIPDATHARSNRFHPELYWPAVWGFIEKYI